MPSVEELPPKFQDGFEALAESTDRQVEVAAIGGNFAFLDVGVWELSQFDVGYDQPETRVWVPLPKQFPNGQLYGMVTEEIVTVENQLPDNWEVNRDRGGPLRAEVKADATLYWSRDWDHMDIQDKTEMTKVIPWVRSRLRHPFEGS
jgi:hypothetical protein